MFWTGISAKPKHRVRAIGIDLGTTNSTVAEAVWDPARPDTIEIGCCDIPQPTLQGLYTHMLVPSVVAIRNGETFVGEGAKRLRTQLVDHGLVERHNVFAETKNEIGTSRIHPSAPEDFRRPRDIAAHVLRFLRSRLETPPAADETVVVTVPASFQAAQRADTRAAATAADIPSASLLDEPVAAFLDYAHSSDDLIEGLGAGPRRLLVFDFGGGTCDVAVFQLELTTNGGLQIAPLSVSRYHRLGGGDIDKAIIHEVLIPQLIEQNDLGPHELGFADKKNVIAPSLAGLAEALKVGLCDLVARRIAFGKYSDDDRAEIVKAQPGTHPIRLGERVLTLASPTLSARQFEALLKPFLDTDLLYARSTEYRMTCSIFAPIDDALERAGLAPDDVDLALLVGGSTRIPQLLQRLTTYFSAARFLHFEDRERHQTSIARGAALQALRLAITGTGLVTPVAADRIALRTASETRELIARGAALPFPEEGHASLRLAAPRSSEREPVDVRIEVLGGEDGEERMLFSGIWSLQAPVTRGERLDLSYRLDGDQVMTFGLRRFEAGRSRPFEATIENPLTNVVNPNRIEEEIEQIETVLRSGDLDPAARDDKLNELVLKCDEIGHVEKAIEVARRLLRKANRPDSALLNRLGLLYEKIGDFDKSEQMFREAAASGRWKGPLFNLALQLQQRNRLQEALNEIRAAQQVENRPAYGMLEAQILEDLGEDSLRDEVLDRNLPRFGPLHTLSDWELGWYRTGCRLAGDAAKVDAADDERRSRKRVAAPAQLGSLPILAEGAAA